MDVDHMRQGQHVFADLSQVQALGVLSMRTLTVSRSSLSVRGMIRAPMSRDTTTSACSHAVTAMTMAPTITATDPSASFRTSGKAASMLKLWFRPEASTTSPTAFGDHHGEHDGKNDDEFAAAAAGGGVMAVVVGVGVGVAAHGWTSRICSTMNYCPPHIVFKCRR